MPFDLKNLNPPIRCEYNDEEWVELRQPSPEDMKKIFQELGCKWKVDKILNSHTRRMERIEYLDIPKDRADIYEESIVDLKIVNWNLKTTDGEEIPCNRANKILLMRGEPKFAAWVEKQLIEAEQAEAEALEAEVKNL